MQAVMRQTLKELRSLCAITDTIMTAGQFLGGTYCGNKDIIKPAFPPLMQNVVNNRVLSGGVNGNFKVHASFLLANMNRLFFPVDVSKFQVSYVAPT